MRNIYISECGQFIAFSLGNGNFDVLQSNGDYWPDPPLCEYPLARQIGGFSNLSGLAKRPNNFCFSLDLLECDTAKKIKAGAGNTVIKDQEVRFFKKIASCRLPKWAKAFAALVEETRHKSSKLQNNLNKLMKAARGVTENMYPHCNSSHCVEQRIQTIYTKELTQTIQEIEKKVTG